MRAAMTDKWPLDIGGRFPVDRIRFGPEGRQFSFSFRRTVAF